MSSEEPKDNRKSAEESEEGGIPLHLLKNLRKSGEGGESGSSNENNSDNSALVSIGNTSFGFNFDSEEHSPNENSEDSDDQQRAKAKKKKSGSSSKMTTTAASSSSTQNEMQQQGEEDEEGRDGNSNHDQPPSHIQTQQRSNSSGGSSSLKNSVSSLTNNTSTTSISGSNAAPAPVASVQPESQQSAQVEVPSHRAAAADAVANLRMIASNSGIVPMEEEDSQQQQAQQEGKNAQEMLAPPSPVGRKRKSGDEGDSSAGYHTDDEGRSINLQSGSNSLQGNDDCNSKQGGRGKKKRLDEKKREERNMREKERSLRISKQINELRNLLSSGGVIVPKGTKSSVLTEAANYIRMLQQHQYRSELDRHQLIQQMQMIGNGAHGAQAASAVRHVAAQNGVWSLGNFGGVPPKSAMSFYQPTTADAATSSSAPDESTSTNPVTHPNKIDTSEYKFVFNSCGVGMAIASLGGAFIDCNQLFCQLSNYSKQEVCGLTIFNLTSRQDLQHAFDLISQMISPPLESRDQEPKAITLRGSMKSRSDIGLSISLVKGDDGIAKCFCVTLVKNPSSPFSSEKPVAVSFDSIQGASFSATPTAQPTKPEDLTNAAPAFTLG